VKRAWRTLAGGLLAAAALLCWQRGAALSRELALRADSVSLRYQSQELEGSDIAAIQNEEDTAVAAWRQTPSQTVENARWGRTRQVSLLEVAGDANLVLPAAQLLSGHYPIPQSPRTCAVDEVSARALWGNADVEGMLLELDGREYAVCGVFQGPEDTVLIQTPPKKGRFSALEIAAPASGQAVAEELVNRCNLPAPALIRNNREETALLLELAPLPLLLPCTALLWWALRAALGGFSPFVRHMCGAALLAGGLWLLCAALGFSPDLTAFLPSRFSDFSHWSALLDAAAQRLRLTQHFSTGAPDALLLSQWRTAAGCIAASILLFLAAIAAFSRLFRPRKTETPAQQPPALK